MCCDSARSTQSLSHLVSSSALAERIGVLYIKMGNVLKENSRLREGGRLSGTFKERTSAMLLLSSARLAGQSTMYCLRLVFMPEYFCSLIVCML